jgi:hypothetical protein
MDRNLENSRAQIRENMQSLIPPTHDERLRTIFIHKIPDGVGGEEGVQKLLKKAGRVRRWDSGRSHLSDHKNDLFGFVQYEDPESLAVAVEVLKDLEVPLKKQTPSDESPEKGEGDEGDDKFEGIEKATLQVSVDPNSIKYIESWKESRGDEFDLEPKFAEARTALKEFVRELFYPRTVADADGDTAMGGANGAGENVEVINIPLAQDDELADIPAEMREVVAAEIAAFRERSNQRDIERLRREEEFEENERRKAGRRMSRDSTSANSNAVPLGPRGVPNAPSGPRGQNRGVDFVNGGTNGHNQDEDDTDASDDELYRREMSKLKTDDERQYLEAERKWVNRERQREAALKRERGRDQDEVDGLSRRRDEQVDREKNWDDEREASRKANMYYRDHAAWVRKRTADRAEEEAHDERDRRAEAEERAQYESAVEKAKDMADSFLDRQAEEIEAINTAPVVPQKFTISFGAAAQKAQASKFGLQRRTIAEVEGLLDDEEQEKTTKRQLVPIKFDPVTDTKTMSEEDLQNALRSLAQEIPSEKEGLWAWDVKWDYLEESIIQERFRPFVEKKIVEYLGVQEQFLVEMVEKHLRTHQKPGDLVDTLAEALDDDAEDLVKKLWRMVIFFTESEKRGLPA